MSLPELIERYDDAVRDATNYDRDVFTPAMNEMHSKQTASLTMDERSVIRQAFIVTRDRNQSDLELIQSRINDIELNQIRLLRLHNADWRAITGCWYLIAFERMDYARRANEVTSNAYEHDPRLALGGAIAEHAVIPLLEQMQSSLDADYHTRIYLTMAKIHYAWHEMTGPSQHKTLIGMLSCTTRSKEIFNDSLHMYDDVDNYHKSGGSRYLADLDGIGKSVANLIAQYLWPGGREVDIDDSSAA